MTMCSENYPWKQGFTIGVCSELSFPEYLQGDELREVLGIVLDGCWGKAMSLMLRDVLHEELHLGLNMITYI